ncbi:hypothetical protein GCM10027168_47490 [Streptomyces capparidis]
MNAHWRPFRRGSAATGRSPYPIRPGLPGDPGEPSSPTGPRRAEGRRPPRHAAPRRSRSGTEPVNARSAVGLRMLLSAVYAPLFAVGAAGFSLAAGDAPPGRFTRYAVLAALCAALTAAALADLAVLTHRRRHPHGQH